MIRSGADGVSARSAGGLEHLIRAGNRVSANVTLSRLNASEVAETVGTDRNIQLSRHRVFAGSSPAGEVNPCRIVFLPPEEIKSAYRQIHSLNSTSFEVVSGDPFAGTLLDIKPRSNRGLTLSGCSTGFSGVTILFDGSVMACRRSRPHGRKPEEETLREIWASSKLLWQLRSRENYRGKCGSCSSWPSCRGCRAITYNLSRDSRQTRPLCRRSPVLG